MICLCYLLHIYAAASKKFTVAEKINLLTCRRRYDRIIQAEVDIHMIICNNCGGALTQTGVCLDCGTVRRKFDILTLIIAIVGLALFPALAVSAPSAISAFNLGSTASNAITALSMIIPASIAVDAVVMSIKRRKTHKTAVSLVLGAIGIVAGLVLALQWVI